MLLVGSLAIAGTLSSGTIAGAHSVANHCSHGTLNGDGGHNKTVWEASNGSGSNHAHQYKHDVAWARDHHPWQGCIH